MNDAGVDFEEDSYSFKRRIRKTTNYGNERTPKMILLLTDKYNITEHKAQKILITFSIVCFLLAILIPIIYFFF